MLTTLCLALAIYHEARGESYIAKLAVSKTIYNRVESNRWPNTICEVIMQPKQFSFVKKGRVPMPKDEKSWQKAYVLAKKIEKNPEILPIMEADHFHSVQVRPVWRKKLHRLVRIGNHIFYSYKQPKAIKTSLRPQIRGQKSRPAELE